MLTTVEGVYRDGKIELAESPVQVAGTARVIVTFLESGAIDLRARGIDEEQTTDLRSRLKTFAEDWDSEEMSVYDIYDSAKSRLYAR